MNSHYTVVYDACVMYPAPLRSFLMYLALTGIYRARWTEQIHDEWIRNLLHKRPDLDSEKLQRTRELMNANVPGSVVSGYESLIGGLSLPDPDDRHVVAAAIQTRAEAIITFNLKDFPSEYLAQYNLQAIHPDEFIADQYDLHASAVIEAARNHRGGLKNPPFDSDQYLDFLLNQGLPQTVSRLRPLHHLI
ncbi:PIN domain-containing protein [Marinobacter nauticus]|uniref:PIN domain-containing protein n=1 Tax=Marinobacter nauticus TaxID=2743 RepID=A0A1M2URL1_MARNT|nr:PIN domain-containing protein [Marinobacter nauticus]OJS97978.1 PIN domain-containing protein [Marinobacter nauticus]